MASHEKAAPAAASTRRSGCGCCTCMCTQANAAYASWYSKPAAIAVCLHTWRAAVRWCGSGRLAAECGGRRSWRSAPAEGNLAALCCAMCTLGSAAGVRQHQGAMVLWVGRDKTGLWSATQPAQHNTCTSACGLKLQQGAPAGAGAAAGCCWPRWPTSDLSCRHRQCTYMG
jgi:hypothetical protein